MIGSRATGGFALAFKADALWVGADTGLVDVAAGRLSASEAGVLLEQGARDFGLDVSGMRRESTMTPEPDHRAVTEVTVTW